jgi:hypothetical protein
VSASKAHSDFWESGSALQNLRLGSINWQRAIFINLPNPTWRFSQVLYSTWGNPFVARVAPYRPVFVAHPPQLNRHATDGTLARVPPPPQYPPPTTTPLSTCDVLVFIGCYDLL